MKRYQLLRTETAYPIRQGKWDCLTGDSEYIREGSTVELLKAIDELGRRGCHRRLITDGRLFAWVDASDVAELNQEGLFQ